MKNTTPEPKVKKHVADKVVSKKTKTSTHKNKPNKQMIPPVIPMTQIEIDEEGKTISKKVKPLTYSLMSWVKRTMKLEDTIDISDDENSSQWSVNVPSLDNEFEFKSLFYVDEIQGLILFYIDYFNESVEKSRITKAKNFILEKNLLCGTGQFQLIESEEGDIYLRYLSGISVKGIASENPNYSGEFQISPKLYDNMFKDGFDVMNSVTDEFIYYIIAGNRKKKNERLVNLKSIEDFFELIDEKK